MRSDVPFDPPRGSAQGSTGRVRTYLWEATTVVKQLGDGQRADAHRVPTCPKAIPLVIHKKSPCACLALFIVQVYINTSCNTIDVDKAPLCAYLLLPCARHAPACVCPSCAHAQHLPARALPMPAHALCLRVFAMLVFLAYYFTGTSIQKSACAPTRTPDSVGDSCGAKPKTLVCQCPASVSMHLVLFYLSVL